MFANHPAADLIRRILDAQHQNPVGQAVRGAMPHNPIMMGTGGADENTVRAAIQSALKSVTPGAPALRLRR